MIIKSMSRKEPSFGQLIDYIDSEKTDEKHNIFHNCFSENTEELRSEFEENAQFLKKRKNGVFMYHEILSVKLAEGLDRESQKEILREIAREYIDKRAPNNLVFAALHNDKEHNLHYHFLISSNEVGSAKRLRLAKTKFEKIKKDLEQYVLEQYPQLKQERLISLSNEEKMSKRELQKDRVREAFLKTLRENNTYTDLNFYLHKEGLKIYQRGNTLGLQDISSGKKIRMKTLGVEDQYLEFVHAKEQEERVAGYEQEKAHQEAQRPPQDEQKTQNWYKPDFKTHTRSESEYEASEKIELAGQKKKEPEAEIEDQDKAEFKEAMKSLREDEDEQENEEDSGMTL